MDMNYDNLHPHITNIFAYLGLASETCRLLYAATDAIIVLAENYYIGHRSANLSPRSVMYSVGRGYQSLLATSRKIFD